MNVLLNRSPYDARRLICLNYEFPFYYLLNHFDIQREGKGIPEASLPFHRAMPSLTHMALVELERAGILKFVISQVP